MPEMHRRGSFNYLTLKGMGLTDREITQFPRENHVSMEGTILT